jgi:hypothetical protein
MNIALEQTEEYVNGQLKNKYGDAFIRGNNGKSVGIITYDLGLIKTSLTRSSFD